MENEFKKSDWPFGLNLIYFEYQNKSLAIKIFVRDKEKSMEGIIINGIGAYTPSKIVTNDDLSKIVETSDEWIRSRTGIKERRISQGEDTSYMGIKASEKAIELANLQREDIDLIVFSTCTPDMFIPSSACIVQKEMGLKNAVAFDLNYQK